MNDLDLTVPDNRIMIQNRGIDKALVVSAGFSMVLVMARVMYTGSLMYLFLVWNLFLGFLPYLITRSIVRKPALIAGGLKFTFAFLLWLFWMPNSFYIITDLFHLYAGTAVPRWFDLALIMSFAWNGLLMGVLSVRQMEKIWQERVPRINGWCFILPVMFLNAWGVYIGRYLRFNTWDIVSSPFALMADIFDMLVHPMQNKYAWGMVLCFTGLMWVMYISLKQLSRAIR